MTQVVTNRSVRRAPARPVATPPEKHVPGETGVWLVIFGEIGVFTVLFVLFLLHRGQEPELFRRSQAQLDTGIGFANTLLLLTGSLLVVGGVRMVRAEFVRLASRLFGGAILAGLGFIVLKVLEYHGELAKGVDLTTNTFFTDYFVFTGVHLFHVVLGVIALTVVRAKARSAKRTRGRMIVIEGASCYWHMVDLVWIVLFPLIYLVR